MSLLQAAGPARGAERAHPHAWLAAIQLIPGDATSLCRVPSPLLLFAAVTKLAGATMTAPSMWFALGAALLRPALGHTPWGGTSIWGCRIFLALESVCTDLSIFVCMPI